MVNDAKDARIGKEADAQQLEDLFAAARETAPMPSRALWERVLADSQAHLPEPVRPDRGADRARPRQPLLVAISAALGGWGLMAGLATATIAGLWIGYAHPHILRQMGPNGPVAGMGHGAAAGFELEDFEPGLDEFSALLEDG